MDNYPKAYFNSLLTLIFIFSVSTLGISQNYNMGSGSATNGSTIITCSGNFYDQGGSSGDHGNNRNTTVTFCSNNSKPMTMNFTSFDIEGGVCENDYLEIYDGNSTGSPLIGRYCGTNSPGFITASGTCLTVRFISNGSVNGPGWVASLGCYECIDNSTCATQYIDLDFSDNTITKTLDPGGWVGDEWRFDNVYAGTYAKVKIVGVQNVVTQAVNNIDNATQPFAQAWSPELGFNIVGGQDSYVDWEVTFYDNTTNAVKPLPKASRVTSYDVDGPNNRNPYTELHGHTSPDGYIVGSGSQLSVLNEPPRTMVLGATQEYDGISNNDFSKITFYYSASLTVFKIRLGIRAAAGASGSVPARQYALGFVACPNFDNPVVNPVINRISGPSTLCANNLTETYSVSNNFASIVWTASGGLITSGQGTPNVTITWSGVGNHKVSVVTTDGSSCVVNNSRAVTVHALPTAMASNSTPAVCTGQTISLSASGGTSYAWSGPSGFTSNQQNPSRSNATLAMGGTYIVTVTDQNGCSSTASTSVTVSETPSINLTISSAEVCRGASMAMLSYSATNGSPTTFSIDFVNGITDINNAPFSGGIINIPISPSLAPGTYNGTLTVHSPNCNSSNVNVSVVVFDPATVYAGPDMIHCQNGSQVVLPITLVGATRGGGAATASWSIISGGGTLSGANNLSNPATATFTPPAYIPVNGNYSIDVVLRLTTNDPVGPCPAVIDERVISINYLVAGSISSSQTICTGGTPVQLGGN